jgi:hypothetical protein
MAKVDLPARTAVHASLSTVVVATSAPYGYTLGVWSSGALLVHSHGVPSVTDVLTFVAGAIAGFDLLALLVADTRGEIMSIDRRYDRLLGGVLDWLALGIVVGGTSLLTDIHGWVPWLVVPFFTTVSYLLIASLQLAAFATPRMTDSQAPDGQS